MKEAILLTIHLLTTIAKLLGPGGGRSVIAENLLLKHQLLIHSRSRQRSPNLSVSDRALLGFWTLFLNPRRMARAAILIKPSTLLNFHAAMKRRKYRLLFSSGRGGKPGPKGPSKEVVDAIVAMKRRNPRFGCPRIAQQINLAFGLDLNKDIVRRILVNHYRPDPGEYGPSWLTTLDQHYYNEHRSHSSRDGGTPVEPMHNNVVDIKDYRWNKHCRGLYELPVAV